MLVADRPIVTIGLRDVIVVDAGDVVLVASADSAQQVKAAAERWAAGDYDLPPGAAPAVRPT